MGLRLLAVLLPLALFAACAEGDAEDGAEAPEEGAATAKSDAGNSAAEASTWTPPTPVSSTNTPTPPGSSSSTPPPSGSTPPPSGSTTPPPAPVEKSTTCVASKTEGSSVLRTDVTLYFLPAASGNNVTLKRFELLVKSGFGNDKNDADINSVTGTSVTKLFSTGDILKNNVKVTVDAGNRILQNSQKVRVTTNYDKSFASDPSASCDLSLN